ncbi:Homeodomain [Teratosphaeria destructans]|uniref:Homeodomain n=1 Tax=Teratosphaeria destructans TaxID=418781 RepID=A0A9W7T061_9PEZI|nr:Homeodomain [Teratosphaeria destructans]
MSVDKHRVPLSPPNSPRMSGTTTKHDDYQWQRPRASAINHTSETLPPLHSTLLYQQDLPASSNNLARPPLGPPRGYPHPLEPSSLLQHEARSAQTAVPTSGGAMETRSAYNGSQAVEASDLPAATFGENAAASPTSRLTPTSAEGELAEEPIDDEEDIGFGSAGQPEGEEDRPPMTAAELRAAKRKMKRFRLTHQQTRFLMNEFSRQPHPDAAHRERLSREIPGLSPRQVQVWFQNRRAKLKRLTTDDRERMMRSRALPANFDMTQALHSPFGASAQNVGAPLPAPGDYPAYAEISGIRPLTLDTLRGVPDYEAYGHQYASPTGISPAIGGFSFTPPHSATETMAPSTAYTFQTQASPRRPPLGISTGDLSQDYGTHLPRPSYHDRLSRSTAELARSPLRTSMSYSALGSSAAVGSNQQQDRSFSYSGDSSGRPGLQRRMTGPLPTTSSPYGIGLNYAPLPSYASPTDQQQRQMTDPASQGLAGIPSYRRSSESLVNQPGTTMSPYQPAQYSTPTVPPYAQYQNQSYQGPFPYQGRQQPAQELEQHTSSTFGTMTSQHPFASLGGTTDVETPGNSPGGVPLPQEYR